MEFNAYNMTKTPQAKANKERAMKVQTAKVKVTRVNPAVSGYNHKNDVAPSAVKGNSKYTPRVRDANEATPPSFNLWTHEIYDGAELRPFDGRKGAMDFKALPSKGLSV